jgi:mannose-6-phosphate isomerase-like protein (cupin superfamily)
MSKLIVLLLATLALSASAQDVPARIVHNGPAKYRTLSSVHAGAGQMGFTQLVGRDVLATNFLYLHAGVIQPKGGIGHHFHHNIEEMYVLLNGEAEFTVNGRTSRLRAPVAVPCKKGDSHAIYNPTSEPLRWLNFAVSTNKGQGDAFDLGDNRVGAPIDKVPVFVNYQFKKDGLRDTNHPYAGNGALYKRAFGPEIFSTNWNNVDQLVIPAGKSVGPRQLEGIEEVYYVIKGTGTVTANGFSNAIGIDDSFTASLSETLAVANTGTEDLELLVIGIASKNEDLNRLRPAAPIAIVLQMEFIVPKENGDAFEKMYHSIYVPAMTVQQGFLGSKLLRLFKDEAARAIEAEATVYNYQIQISFDTEENRKKWVASPQHQIAWPAASALATSYKWKGYDLMGNDGN